MRSIHQFVRPCNLQLLTERLLFKKGGGAILRGIRILRKTFVRLLFTGALVLLQIVSIAKMNGAFFRIVGIKL